MLDWVSCRLNVNVRALTLWLYPIGVVMLYYYDFLVSVNHCTSFEIHLYPSLSVVHVSVFCAWRLNSETFMCKTGRYIHSIFATYQFLR